jgi:hypothetical protein
MPDLRSFTVAKLRFAHPSRVVVGPAAEPCLRTFVDFGGVRTGREAMSGHV